MTTIAVLNDIHLKPAYETVVEDFRLPPETDCVVIAGDLLDSDDAASIDQGRRLLTRLDDHEIPTVYVPGNHDPLPCAKRLVDGFEYVQVAHGRRVGASSFPGATFADIAVVGWGCTQFDAGRELEYDEAEAFSVRDDHGYVDRYRESQAVERLLEAVDELFEGAVDPDGVRTELGLTPRSRAHLRSIVEVGEQLRDLIAGPTPTLLATHVPPFGTDLDRHHSTEGRPEDGLHNGSLAVAGAIRTATPAVACFGHSHVRGYRTYDGVSTHLLNGGFRGITTVDLEAGRFGFSFHEPEWLPGDP